MVLRYNGSNLELWTINPRYQLDSTDEPKLIQLDEEIPNEFPAGTRIELYFPETGQTLDTVYTTKNLSREELSWRCFYDHLKIQKPILKDVYKELPFAKKEYIESMLVKRMQGNLIFIDTKQKRVVS